ncbi:RHS repeat-associated core domain-containing protein [Paraburkholderia sp.]|uniref:RHS repeat-associated core domain-containing protein n=1 Tax=Paraburkholderia sp. TaxID=1926495 RepID=UPI003D6DDFA3
MADTPNYDEPGGSARDRLANIQHLEDGDAAKAADQAFYGHANDAMLGADVGMTTVEGAGAGLGAAGTALLGGASGSAALGAGAIATGTVLLPMTIAIGGAYAAQKLGVTDWIADKFVSAGDALGLTIGRGDPHPACVGDKVAHSSAFWGIVAGIAVGVAIGAAVAATVATGGLAGAVIVGACMAGGLTLGSALASASQHMGSDCGEIKTGSDDVYFEGRKVARVTDLVKCDHHSDMPQPIVDGSKTIFVNGLALARIGHETHCSGKINSGRNSIWIDRTTAQYGPKNPELTAGQEFLAGLLGAAIGAGVGKWAGGKLRERFRPKATESAEVAGRNDETTLCKEDPIDVATGEMVEIRIDVSIPGVLPLQLARRYRTHSTDSGLLGPKWSTSWSQRLDLADGHLVRFHSEGGQTITFVAPDPWLDGINLRAPRYRLTGTRDEPRILDHKTRQVLVFAPLAHGRTSRIERIEDLNGNAIAFTYDPDDRLIALAHSDGYRLDLDYYGSRRVVNTIVLREASGKTQTLTEYAYDGSMLARAASFQCGDFHYTYDVNGWMTGWRDSDQTDVRYLYDDAGRVIETGTRQGYHTGRFIYEDGRTRVIDGDGEWFYEHNADGLVTVETNPLGHSTLREWGLGRLLSQTDELGRRSRFHYDETGNLLAIEEHTGRVSRFEYDDNRLMTAVVLPDGERVKLEYDRLRRLIARTAPDGTVRRYRYGERGELLRVVDGERETRFDYDAQLRLIATRLPSGARFRTAFDVFGRLVEKADPDGNIARYDYSAGPDNPHGALAQAVQADGSIIRTRYNGEGLPVEQIDPLGRVARREYGPFDLVTAEIDPAGHATRFEYDHATRLTRVVNALRETWECHYDAAGRLVTEIDWGGRKTQYERDAAGRVLTRTLPDGGTWRYTYDAFDRPVMIDAGDVKQVYTYDDLGRFATAEVHGESTHVTRFAYDEKGRLIGEDQHGHLLKHVYDRQGRRRVRVTPHRETEYEYDALGVLTKVGPIAILRDELGRETGRQVGDFVLQRQYDSMSRLSRQVAGPRSAIEDMQSDPVRALEQLTRQLYAYDAAGQRSQLDTDSDTLTYQHDVRGQVTEVQSLRQPSEHYRYDANLNIASHGSQGPVDTHQYLAGGLPERVGHARYRYDARGRTIEKTVDQPGFRPKTWQYTWDGMNRLVKVRTPDRGVWTYQYDAFNRRVEKRVIGARESVRFLWDGSRLAEQWQEKDGTTALAVTWHISPTDFSPLAQETDRGLYPVLSDQTGLPQAMFDESGQRVWCSKYSLWGQQVEQIRGANDDSALDVSLRFAGQWEDEESGLHYNLQRYYDPATGRYLSVDPIGLEGGLNTHAYVHDPLQWCDPLGLALCQWDSKVRRWRDSSGRFMARPTDLPAGKPMSATVYRYEQPDRMATTWDAHKWNVASDHRYTAEGQGGVYGASSPETALAEVNHYKVDLSTRELTSKDVSLNNVLDLTDSNVRNQLGVSLDDITGNTYPVTQKIGNMAAANGYDGILAPSARNPAGNNLISFAGF